MMIEAASIRLVLDRVSLDDISRVRASIFDSRITWVGVCLRAVSPARYRVRAACHSFPGWSFSILMLIAARTEPASLALVAHAGEVGAVRENARMRRA